MKRTLAALAALLWLLAAPAPARDTVVYYHTDALHSVTVVTNAQGQVLERTHYAPYGTVLNRGLRDGPGYTGHQEDAATGLVYMQQRYYDPATGRFLSPDPVQANDKGGSFNRYWYANDNPYRYTDPDGRCGGPTCDQMVQAYGEWANANPGKADKLGSTVGVAGVMGMLSATGLSEVVGLVKAVATVDKALSDARTATTVTRYMGPGEAKVVARTGEVPNVGKDGIQRPTHVTADAPVNSAVKAQEKYELPATPTHRATVPANRVSDLGSTPDGRSITSGGGSQNATSRPIPIKPDELKRLDH